MDHYCQRNVYLPRPGLGSPKLYEETEESKLKRQAALARIKLERPADFNRLGRPSKGIGAPYQNSLIADGELAWNNPLFTGQYKSTAVSLVD